MNIAASSFLTVAIRLSDSMIGDPLGILRGSGFPDVLILPSNGFYFTSVLSPLFDKAGQCIINAPSYVAAKHAVQASTQIAPIGGATEFRVEELTRDKCELFIKGTSKILVIVHEEEDRNSPRLVTSATDKNRTLAVFSRFLRAALERLPEKTEGPLTLDLCAQFTTLKGNMTNGSVARVYYAPDTLTKIAPEPVVWSDYTI